MKTDTAVDVQRELALAIARNNEAQIDELLAYQRRLRAEQGRRAHPFKSKAEHEAYEKLKAKGRLRHA